VGNGDTADDLTSQTFLKALTACRRSTSEGRHRPVGARHRAQRRPGSLAPDADGCRSTGSGIAAGADPEQAAIQNEQQ
jgi:hypothetical protein